MNEWVMPGKPALIVEHMQYGIVDERGLATRFGCVKAARETGIIPCQQTLIKAFRDSNLPVYFLVSITPPDTPWPVTGRFWPALKASGAMKPGSKDLEVIPELDSRPEEVVTGWMVDPFGQNLLRERLAQDKADTLVIAGVATGTAIMAACWFAANALYNVVVPKDAIADPDPQIHEFFVTKNLPAIAVVTTTEDIVAHL
ncbi:MAG: cysteine hydrolase [Actinobacteria bacterium]|nr:cysteine hydrolase [Actinomycetota bacterium]